MEHQLNQVYKIILSRNVEMSKLNSAKALKTKNEYWIIEAVGTVELIEIDYWAVT